MIRISLPRSDSTSSSRTSSLNEDTLRKYIDQIFERYDPNGDNYIERSEVKKLIREIAFKRRKRVSEDVIEDYVENFMMKADRYGDGKIGKE